MAFGNMNSLDILYEDNHVIVVIKEPNVLSQSDITGDKDLLTMVKSYIKEKYKKLGNVYCGLVHRLDRPVGGIMVFAKTSKAAKRLSEQIRQTSFKKTYLALLSGTLKDNGKLVDYLYKDSKTGLSKVVNSDFKDAKKAELTYEVIANINKNTLVKVHLLTGRHHQIRLQFSNLGYPIIGDARYGKADLKPIRLFAYELSFKHPVKDEIMNFKQLPDWEEIEDETIIHRL